MIYLGDISKTKIKKGKSLELFIAPYHRAATGLLKNSVVYIVPKKTQHKYYTKKHVPELILSPIKPDQWDKTWMIEVWMDDTEGIIKEASGFMAEQGLNIEIQDALIPDNKDLFYLKSIVTSKNSLDIKEQMEVGLLERLKAEFKHRPIKLEEIKVSCDKVRFLNKNILLANGDEKTGNNQIDKDILLPFYGARPTPLILNKNHKIIVEPHVIKELSLENEKKHGEIQYIIISDSEEKYLLLRFFLSDQCVVQLDVKHDDAEGSIAAFTQYIQQIEPDTAKSEDSKINIIGCYNRIKNAEGNGEAHWIALVDITNLKNFDSLLNKEKWKNFKPKNRKENTYDMTKVIDVKILGCTHALEEFKNDSKELGKYYFKQRLLDIRSRFFGLFEQHVFLFIFFIIQIIFLILIIRKTPVQVVNSVAINLVASFIFLILTVLNNKVWAKLKKRYWD